MQWLQAASRKEIPRNWGEVSGPYSAMLLSLNRIGWAWDSLAVFTDHRGNQHNISAIGLKMFSALLKNAWTTRMATTAAANRLAKLKPNYSQ